MLFEIELNLIPLFFFVPLFFYIRFTFYSLTLLCVVNQLIGITVKTSSNVALKRGDLLIHTKKQRCFASERENVCLEDVKK